MKQIVVSAIGFGLLWQGGVATAQDAVGQTVEFGGERWRVAGDAAVVESYRGRETLTFDGRVWADDVDLHDLVVEFDVLSQPFGFFGVSFRGTDDANFEDVYLRNGAQGTPDAMQYMPVINGVSGWQVYTDPRFNAAANFEPETWIHVRLVVVGDQMDVYVDSAEPAMHVPDLQTDNRRGAIGLRATPSSDARFANVVIRPAGPDDVIVGEYTSFVDIPGVPPDKFTTDLPDTLISEFEVSAPFSEDVFGDALDLDAAAAAFEGWQSLGTDINGIANLARVATRSADANTVAVRTRVSAESSGTREFRFGYSDRIRLYLNGRLLYAANNGWQSRDWQHYGRVGLHDTVGLPLVAGDNELIAVVSETFGGWAFMADLPDRLGLAIE